MPEPGEPLWLTEDQDAAFDYMEYLDGLCSGCGQPRHESFDEANFMEYETVALRCHACADKEMTGRARQQDNNASTEGIYLVVDKKG